MRISSKLAALACSAVISSVGLAQARNYDAARSAPTVNQITDQFDAQIAQLKANLRLTTDQEKNWATFQTALHDMAASRAEAFVKRTQSAQDISNPRRDRRDNDAAPAQPNDEPTNTNAAPDSNNNQQVSRDDTGTINPKTDSSSQTNARSDGSIAAMRAKADEFSEMSANLKKTADAVEPLYNSLDDRQRAVTMRFITRNWMAMYPGSREGRY